MNLDASTIPRVHAEDVYVMITKPDGEQRAVKCGSIIDCMDVVEVEGANAQHWTIIQIVARRGSKFTPLARWGKGKDKLVRLGYKR